eukprot:7530289-Karenia_brevis.AAC.1
MPMTDEISHRKTMQAVEVPCAQICEAPQVLVDEPSRPEPLPTSQLEEKTMEQPRVRILVNDHPPIHQ